MVYAIRYGLSPVSYSVRKLNPFPVQMCTATVRITALLRVDLRSSSSSLGIAGAGSVLLSFVRQLQTKPVNERR